MPQNEFIHDASCTPSQPRHREQPRVTLNTHRDFNERTNNGRPPHSRSSTSYKVTFEGNVIAASPPGTSTPGSSENDQKERHLADSDSHADMELILSNAEKSMRRMETKICTLSNLNRQEREGREVLQESCRRLEVAVRAREDEVANLKRRLDESEQERRRVMHELEMQNLRRRTEDDIASRVHVADERTRNKHGVDNTSRYDPSGSGSRGSGWHGERPIRSPQALPPTMEQNFHPGPSVPLPWDIAPESDFVGGFKPARKS